MLQQEKPNHFETIVKLVIVIAISILVFVSPFFLYFNYGGLGIIMYLVLVIMLSPSIAFTYKKFIYFKKNELKKAFLDKKIQIGLTVVFNVFVFLTIGLNTLIHAQELLSLYALCYVPCLFYYWKPFFPFSAVIFASFLTSALLLLNFYWVDNLKEEKYHYFYNGSDVVIFLENGYYKDYKGIRMFFMEEKIKNYGTITYTFGDGILGFRVVKGYRL